MATPEDFPTAHTLFSLRLARELGLDPKLVTSHGMTWERAASGPDVVRITWEGVAYLPREKFDAIHREISAIPDDQIFAEARRMGYGGE